MAYIPSNIAFMFWDRSDTDCKPLIENGFTHIHPRSAINMADPLGGFDDRAYSVPITFCGH